MASVMGQHNNYDGVVHGYAPIHGSGAAVISLVPTKGSVGDKEFDEDDIEIYQGDRHVLESDKEGGEVEITNENIISTDKAPKPVGAYPHARKVGDLLYLSGVGPRQPETNSIPGGAIRDEQGRGTEYDIKAQTRACIENVRTVLEAAGSTLESVQDVTVFLINMDRDFAGFNEVYGEYFSDIEATRTTIAVSALPTPIAVEMKVVAKGI
jgi:2-aminomuconate deaminase